MKKFEEKTVNTTHFFKGKIIDVQVDDVILPNGKKAKREIVKHPGAVAVIGLTPENKLVLVEQYRKPLERTLLEIPAGKIDHGEDPEVTAARELEEETGYAAEKLEHIISFYTSPGFANEIIHIYFAEGLRKVDEPLEGDEDEFVEIHELTLKEALQSVSERKIYDAKTVYAVQYLQIISMKEKNDD